MTKRHEAEMIDLEQFLLESVSANLEFLQPSTQKNLMMVLKMRHDVCNLEEQMGSEMHIENELKEIRGKIFAILLKILETEPLDKGGGQFRIPLDSLQKYKDPHIKIKNLLIDDFFIYIDGDPADINRLLANLKKYYNIKNVADLRRLQKNYSKYLELSSGHRRMLDEALRRIGLPTPKRSLV